GPGKDRGCEGADDVADRRQRAGAAAWSSDCSEDWQEGRRRWCRDWSGEVGRCCDPGRARDVQREPKRKTIRKRVPLRESCTSYELRSTGQSPALFQLTGTPETPSLDSIWAITWQAAVHRR